MWRLLLQGHPVTILEDDLSAKWGWNIKSVGLWKIPCCLDKIWPGPNWKQKGLCFHIGFIAGRGHRKSCKGCIMLLMQMKTILSGKWAQHFSRLFPLLNINHWRMWHTSRNLKKCEGQKPVFGWNCYSFAQSKAAVPGALPSGRPPKGKGDLPSSLCPPISYLVLTRVCGAIFHMPC